MASTLAWKRPLKGIGWSALAIITFAVAMLASVLLHRNQTAPRRVIVRAINSALSGSFKGSLRIVRIGGIGLGGARHVDVVLFSPRGEVVAWLRDASVSLDGVRLARTFLRKSATVELRITGARLAGGGAVLERDENGKLTIKGAFESRKPSGKGPGRQWAVSVQGLHAGALVVESRNVPAGRPWLAHLSLLAGGASYGPAGVQAGIEHLEAEYFGFPQGPVRASLSASVVVPHSGALPRRGFAKVRLALRELSAEAQAVLDGDQFRIAGRIPTTAPEVIRSVAPAVTINEPASVAVDASGDLQHAEGLIGAQLGSGGVSLYVEAFQEQELRLHLQAIAKGLDMKALSPSAPPLSLGAGISAGARLESSGKLQGHYLISIPPTDGRVPIPDVTIMGDFSRNGVDGVAGFRAPQGVGTLKVQARTGPGNSSVAFRAKAQVPMLHELPGAGIDSGAPLSKPRGASRHRCAAFGRTPGCRCTRCRAETWKCVGLMSRCWRRVAWRTLGWRRPFLRRR